MSRPRVVLLGTMACGILLSAEWVQGQAPDKSRRPEGQNVKEQPRSGNQNAPGDNARREGDDKRRDADNQNKDAPRSAGDAKNDANRAADDVKGKVERRVEDTKDGAARSRDDQRDDSRRPADERNRSGQTDRDTRNERDRDESDTRSSREGDRTRSDRTDRNDNRAADRDRKGADFGASIDMQNDRLQISDVTNDSIAARAGLRQGDIVFSVNGQRIDSRDAFDRYLYRSRVARVPIIVLRGNDRHTIYVDTRLFVRDGRQFDNRVAGGAWLGVFLDHEQADRAVLRGIERNSPADRAGLRSGDVILRVDDAEVRSPEDLTRLIGERKAGDRVELALGGQSRETITVTLGQRPDAAGDRYERSVLPVPDRVDVDVSPRGGVDVDVDRSRRIDRRGRR